jgi:hypothetical protein
MNAMDLANKLNIAAGAMIFQPIAFNVIKATEKIKITMLACGVITIDMYAIRLGEHSAQGIIDIVIGLYPEFKAIIQQRRKESILPFSTLFA